jgi:hypothetical protein
VFSFSNCRVRLSPLGTAATSGLLYQPQMIDDGDCGAISGMKIGRGNCTWRKPAPVPLCSPQIPHDLTQAQTQATMVGSQWLTAWAMARTFSNCSLDWELSQNVASRIFGKLISMWKFQRRKGLYKKNLRTNNPSYHEDELVSYWQSAPWILTFPFLKHEPSHARWSAQTFCCSLFLWHTLLIWATIFVIKFLV